MKRPFPPRAPLSIALALYLGAASGLALAGETPADQSNPRHDHTKTLEAVEVTATPLADTAESLAVPVEVLSGARLDEAKASSLGETVNKLPGVQSSYFGPGVGRPIVRGFDGAQFGTALERCARLHFRNAAVDHVDRTADRAAAI